MGMGPLLKLVKKAVVYEKYIRRLIDAAAVQ